MDINQAWKETCRVVLGGEIGELQDYEKYLLRYVEPTQTQKSFISAKSVSLAYAPFAKSARFISYDELGLYEKYLSGPGRKLAINSIKDIDSILSAMGEAFAYCGDMHVGNCQDISQSDRCENAQVVYRSNEVYDSKFVACSSLSRFDSFVFGSSWLGESNYLIKCFYTHKLARSMETYRVLVSSDCYYSSNLEGCSDCLFSFNQRNKSRLIGNTAFPAADYAAYKAKLLGEMRDTLKRKKTLPSIISFLGGSK